MVWRGPPTTNFLWGNECWKFGGRSYFGKKVRKFGGSFTEKERNGIAICAICGGEGRFDRVAQGIFSGPALANRNFIAFISREGMLSKGRAITHVYAVPVRIFAAATSLGEISTGEKTNGALSELKRL